MIARKILIADDALSTRLRLKTFSEQFGYKTIIASDGLEAWNCWKKERPRIVITDLYMPQMDGFQLCRKIRENEGDDYTYIIIVTILDEQQKFREGKEAGADEFLPKPFNKDEVKVMIMAGERILDC